MQKFTFVTLLIFVACTLTAQQKYEKESRIQRSEAPQIAVGFVDSMHLSGKIKWYKELGINTISYEAKTKHKGQRLSIEFSSAGIFEDLEIEIKPGEIPSGTCQNVIDYLQSEHARYKIKKVQVQYSGDNETIKSYPLPRKVPETIIVNYEIVVSTKLEGSYVMFEYLFDEQGRFVRKSRIVLNMTDNIEY